MRFQILNNCTWISHGKQWKTNDTPFTYFLPWKLFDAQHTISIWKHIMFCDNPIIFFFDDFLCVNRAQKRVRMFASYFILHTTSYYSKYGHEYIVLIFAVLHLLSYIFPILFYSHSGWNGLNVSNLADRLKFP